ncbi:hypothetical protein EG351_14170 [Chryseobacterium bernardetii]|nr:hypothetical protein EG351_14170 [Chryseobacterium bernardetii]
MLSNIFCKDRAYEAWLLKHLQAWFQFFKPVKDKIPQTKSVPIIMYSSVSVSKIKYSIILFS